MTAFLLAAFIAGVLKWYWWIADHLLWYWFMLILATCIMIPQLFFSASKKAQAKKERLDLSRFMEIKFRFSKRELTIEEIVETDLNELDGPDFVKMMAMYYLDKRYSVQIISGPGDHEVDIILTDPTTNRKIAVQCKYCKTKNVGNDKVLRLGAGKKIHDCHDAWCITTGNYTAAAKETAEGLSIRLINGKNVKDLIEKWQKLKMLTS